MSAYRESAAPPAALEARFCDRCGLRRTREAEPETTCSFAAATIIALTRGWEHEVELCVPLRVPFVPWWRAVLLGGAS